MSNAKQAPRVPVTIVDEAGDSPAWLPLAGFGLLVLAALFVAVHQAIGAPVDAAHTPAPAITRAATHEPQNHPAAEPAVAPEESPEWKAVVERARALDLPVPPAPGSSGVALRKLWD